MKSAKRNYAEWQWKIRCTHPSTFWRLGNLVLWLNWKLTR